jgi:serpin B
VKHWAWTNGSAPAKFLHPGVVPIPVAIRLKPAGNPKSKNGGQAMTLAGQKRVGGALLLLGMLGLCATACDSRGGSSSISPGEAVQSEKERITSPDVAQTDLDDLVTGNSAFAFDLYQQERGDEDGNIFYSPYSISVALAMTYAGARNETEQQMADTLRFTLPQDRLHPAFNALDLELASRAETTSDEDGEGFRLNIVNRIWGRTGYSFLGEFLDVLAENYGAGLYVLDFAGAPEESRILINDWVSDQTEERIQDLIPPRAITPLTVLVLTNAIYFKAAWNEPFDETLTQDGLFHLLDGGEVTVPMMRQGAAFGYAAGDGYQVVELPYDGEELSMVILLPDADRFEEFESTLDAEAVEAAVQDLTPYQVNLTMPRFTFEWDTSLKEVLSALGMSIAFGAEADFSGMNELGGLFISDVIHKAFVAVDEEGTEAAAATAVIIDLGAAPMPEAVVTIDRPFIFLIRDIETGAILFVGRVVNPS